MSNILPDLQAEYKAQIEALKAENARLKASAMGGRFKVTDKGGVSCYGLGRFPVTLYRSQWEKLRAVMPDLFTFIEANADRLTSKDD